MREDTVAVRIELRTLCPLGDDSLTVIDIPHRDGEAKEAGNQNSAKPWTTAREGIED
jgi:hypothetical protein